MSTPQPPFDHRPPQSPQDRYASIHDHLTLDAAHLAERAVTGVRWAFGIAGGAALIAGVLLLVWPQHTIVVLAVAVGAYLVVAGGVRIVLGLFGRSIGVGHRVLGVLLGTLMLVAGIVALRDVAIATQTLLFLIAIVVGVGWIVEGIMAVSEAGASRSAGWSRAYGVVSVLGGVAILAVPTWSGFWLLMFAAVVLIVLGLLGLMRAFSFGRALLKRARGVRG
jgi:uncharacterized membrane protein HdeD (DUF308 family)